MSTITKIEIELIERISEENKKPHPFKVICFYDPISKLVKDQRYSGILYGFSAGIFNYFNRKELFIFPYTPRMLKIVESIEYCYIDNKRDVFISNFNKSI